MAISCFVPKNAEQNTLINDNRKSDLHMRTAIISDIHGNYPALVSVLADVKVNNVDKLVFIGDYIFDLPFSSDVVKLLMSLEDAVIIKGNKEARLPDMAREDQANWKYDQMGGAYQTFRELTPELYEYLCGLDDDRFVQLSEKTTLFASHLIDDNFVRAAVKNNCSSHKFHINMVKKPFTHEQYLAEFNEWINAAEQKTRIEKINADVIVFGHNHLQSYGYCGDKLVVNPGSCGLPLDYDNRAAYSIIEETNKGFIVHEKRVAYDFDYVIEKTRESTIYEKGKVWSELTFMSLRTGLDYYGLLFEIARGIAKEKSEESAFFSNSTWGEAYRIFKEKYK